MDEMDILLLAERDVGEAAQAAALCGFDALAAKLERRNRGPNLFELLRAARVTINDVANVAGIPVSTAQAAAQGKANGGLTHYERRRVLDHLKPRLAALQAAVDKCEGKGKLKR